MKIKELEDENFHLKGEEEVIKFIINWCRDMHNKINELIIAINKLNDK